MSGAPKYILTERIAQGGMAEIHLGKSVGLDGFARVCAFKRILPHFAQDQEFIQMFRNEAMVAKQLQNKNIVQVYDFVSDGTSYMLVMEFVDGQDLRAVLAASEQQRKRIPIEIACFFVIECLSGLSYAHGAVDVSGRTMGIIHRDVSPQNVLISYEGDVKITDFGIAKAQNQSSQTRAGVLKGKFRYMSPEQAMGQTIDARSDVFAVGVILWEMLTMQRLFKGEDMAVLEAVRQCKVKPPSGVNGAKIPPELDAIVMKFLAKDVTKRYQSAKEAIRDLNKFLYSVRSDFFAGEAAEFMHQLFRDRLSSARERLRSTLALPVGALGGGAFEMFGHSDPASSPSSVVDMSRPAQKAPPAAVPMARPQAAAGMGIGSPSSGGQQSGNQTPLALRSGAPQGEPLELVVGRNAHQTPGGGRSLGHSGGASGGATREAYGGASGQRGSPVGLAKPRMRPAGQMNMTRTTVVPQSRGLGGEGILLIAILLISGLFLGYLAATKFGILPRTSEVTIDITPAAGSVRLELDGQPLFGNKFVTSPLKIPLPANKEHVLTVKKLGFQDKKTVLKAPLWGGPQKESIILEKGPQPLASLRILSTPPGARVVLEAGMAEGKSPQTFPFLPVGRSYTIVLSHPHCEGSTRHRITLRPGDERMGVMAKNLRLKGCSQKSSEKSP